MKITNYLVKDNRGILVAIQQRRDSEDGRKVVLWQNAQGDYGLSTPLKELPLYGSEHIVCVAQDIPIIITEGPKACDALLKLGIPSLGTVTGAALIPETKVLEVLSHRSIILWPDNDTIGREHMNRLGILAQEHMTDIWIVQWHTLLKGADAFDLVLDLKCNVRQIRRWINHHILHWQPFPMAEKKSPLGRKTQMDISIVDVVSKFLTLRKNGNTTWVAICPWHLETTASLTFFAENDSYYCFGCRCSGYVLDFLNRYNNWTDVQSLGYLKENFNCNASS